MDQDRWEIPYLHPVLFFYQLFCTHTTFWFYHEIANFGIGIAISWILDVSGYKTSDDGFP